MRRFQILMLIGALAIGAVGNAEDEKRSEAKKAKKSTKSTEVASARTDRMAPKIYIPPARGATRTRTGGGTRSISHLPKLVALVPDHVGRTARSAPELFWFVAGEADVPLVLTISREDAVEPDLETTLTEHVEAGIGRASLGELGVELEPGVVYRWSVALVADAEERERDAIASGAIERVAAPAGLGESTGYRELAANGLWYDALAELGGAIEAGDADLRSARAQLLDEVGLSSAAEYDRGAR